jgi:hypothetical protein
MSPRVLGVVQAECVVWRRPKQTSVVYDRANLSIRAFPHPIAGARKSCAVAVDTALFLTEQNRLVLTDVAFAAPGAQESVAVRWFPALLSAVVRAHCFFFGNVSSRIMPHKISTGSLSISPKSIIIQPRNLITSRRRRLHPSDAFCLS